MDKLFEEGNDLYDAACGFDGCNGNFYGFKAIYRKKELCGEQCFGD